MIFINMKHQIHCATWWSDYVKRKNIQTNIALNGNQMKFEHNKKG